jgi:hypothetical protein
MLELRGPAAAKGFVEYCAGAGATSFKAHMHVTRAELAAEVKAAHASHLKIAGHLCSAGFREAAAISIDNLGHGVIEDGEIIPGRSSMLAVLDLTPRSNSASSMRPRRKMLPTTRPPANFSPKTAAPSVPSAFKRISSSNAPWTLLADCSWPAPTLPAAAALLADSPISATSNCWSRAASRPLKLSASIADIETYALSSATAWPYDTAKPIESVRGMVCLR